MPLSPRKSRRKRHNDTTGATAATEMKKLLLMIALFSGAISEVPRANDRKEPSPRVAGKQFWAERGKRIPRDAGREDFDDSSGHKPGRSSRFSAARLLAEPPKLPPLALLRYPNDACCDTGNSEPCDSRCRTGNPALLILIDFRESSNDRRRSTLSCKSEKCRRRAYQWELQKPFYVEEPRWVQIEPMDYTDDFTDGLGASDPFVLSRGKKVLESEDVEEQTDGSNLDQEGQEKRKKGRWTTTSKRNEEEKTPREEEEEKKRRGRDYIGDLDNFEKYDPFFLTRGKRARVDGSNRRDRWNREDSPKDRRGEEALETRKLGRVKRSVDKFENIDWIDKGLETTSYPGDSESFSVWNDNRDNSRPMDSKIKEIRQGGKESSIEGNTDFSTSDEVNSRAKRSYDDFKSTSESMLEEELERRIIEEYHRWLENIRASVSSQRRIRRGGKTDIFDILQQPFFISRGKKDTEGGILPRIQGTKTSEEDAASMDVLDRLLESLKCSSADCASDLERMARERALRDRRGGLRDLLGSYDPFYVSRGKRTIEESIPSFAKIYSIARTNATRPESGVLAGKSPTGISKATKDDFPKFKEQY